MLSIDFTKELIVYTLSAQKPCLFENMITIKRKKNKQLPLHASTACSQIHFFGVTPTIDKEPFLE